jgi:hypothetical protein
VTNLKRIANILILILLTLAILGYFITNRDYNQIKVNSKLLFVQDKVLSELLFIQSAVRELKFINYGIYDLTPAQITAGLTFDKTTAVTELKT